MIIFTWIWSFLKCVGRNWKIVLPAVAVLIVVIFVYRACHKRAQIDEASIQKINKANEAERKAELSKVISENADTIKTVDERNTIAEADETQRNAQIWAKVDEADKKIAEAKAATGRDVTSAELECILVPENCPAK